MVRSTRLSEPISGLGIRLGGYSNDTINKAQTPTDIFMQDGLSITITGPRIDASSLIKNKLRKARQQGDTELPFVVIIDSMYLMGSLSDNINVIRNVFQPDLNTRVSSVSLCRHDLPRFQLQDFNYVSNPYAKNPVVENIARLFR